MNYRSLYLVNSQDELCFFYIVFFASSEFFENKRVIPLTLIRGIQHLQSDLWKGINFKCIGCLNYDTTCYINLRNNWVARNGIYDYYH